MASRAILKPTIVFGMVAIPVRVISAYNTDNGHISLHWMHVGEGGCGGAVGYLKRCKECKAELEQYQIGSGYLHEGKLIELTDADLESLPLPTKERIDLVQFVSPDDIPTPMYSTMYYLEPQPVGRGPYDLLARVLSERDVLGIGVVTLRSKESLCAIRADSDNTLVLETLRRPGDVKAPPKLDPVAAPSREALDMAGLLVQAQTKPFDASIFTDHYQAALSDLVAAKINGTAIPQAATVPTPAATDLMAQLRASLAQARQQAPT